MNKIGIYYAYWARNWDADFVPFVKRVKNLGFEVLEVNSGTVTRMNNRERDRLKCEAEKYGIELTFCIGLTREFDIAAESASVRKRGIGFLKKQARMVQTMGARALGGIIYGSWPGALPAGEGDKRPYWRRSVKSMREVIKVVEDCGILFNVEVVNRFEQYLLNTASEAVRYVEEVGSPHCKILLDTFHMNIEEDSFAGAIRTAGKRLGHVHLGETNRRAPGRGKIPWREIGHALCQVRYRGALVMEPFLVPGGEVGRDIKIYRDLSIDVNLDGEARRACRFIKEVLA